MPAFLQAEWRKYPLFASTGLVAAMPLGVVLLKTLGFLLRKPYLLERDRFHWQAFLQTGHMEWTQMLLPLTMASWAVYLWWLEQEGNTWKTLFIQPHGRSKTYLAKLFILGLWLGLFFALNGLAHLAAGLLLFSGQTVPLMELGRFHLWGVVFAGPVLLAQNWLTLRFPHPMVPLVLCLTGNIVALVGSGLWLRAFPWHYCRWIGTLSVDNHLPVLASCLGLSFFMLLLGYWESLRKEVL